MRVALVTGGGGGIGEAVCARLASEGIHVIVTDVLGDAAGRVARSISERGGQATAHALDVTDEEGWKRVVATLDRIDILVNNAGISQIRPLAKLTLADWNRDLAVNLTGPFLGVATTLDLMTRTVESAGSFGAIVNVCSVAALNGAAVMPGYAASKGGLRAFSKSIAVDLIAKKIRVNAIFPGMTDTGLMGQMLDAQVRLGRHATTDDARASWSKASPIGRVATPTEMANVIAFLVSDAAEFVVGAEIVVDAGKTLQ